MTTATSPVVVEVHNLVKRYDHLTAVDGISFTVQRGEVFGMLGPNGAGKTTTVEIIEGLNTADSGSVRVLGTDVRKAPRAVKERIGVQLQTPALYPRLKVWEVLDLFGSFFPRAEAPDKLIALLGLEESREKLTKNLSGGQQQRLSVALALVNQPEIVFLDEPTTGLDPQARLALWSVIERLRNEGRTVFLTTHYLEEAERLCDTVLIIDHGRIVALGRPRDLIAEHFHEAALTFECSPAIPEEALRALPSVSQVNVEQGDVTMYSRSVPETAAALLTLTTDLGIEVRNLSVRHATLEDVFLKLTGRRLRE
jgi:ABC-2 type transport system ATP-binding protein